MSTTRANGWVESAAVPEDSFGNRLYSPSRDYMTRPALTVGSSQRPSQKTVSTMCCVMDQWPQRAIKTMVRTLVHIVFQLCFLVLDGVRILSAVLTAPMSCRTSSQLRPCSSCMCSLSASQWNYSAACSLYCYCTAAIAAICFGQCSLSVPSMRQLTAELRG